MAQRGKELPTKPDNLSSGGGVRSYSVEVLVHDPSTWEWRAAEVWGIVQQLSLEHPPISSWGNLFKTRLSMVTAASRIPVNPALKETGS